MSGGIHGTGNVPEGARRLGEILLAQHIIDEFDLRCAMRIVREKGKQLGDVLMENDLATPVQIQLALELQQQMSRDDLDRESNLWFNPRCLGK